MPEDIEAYIHRQIPITAAMGVRVTEATIRRVELAAPLEPNINHRETVFGGSAAAVATLAAWTLVLVRMRSAGLTGRLVIARNSMEFRKPITGDFTGVATEDNLKSWQGFVAGLNRKGKGRVTASASLFIDSVEAAAFQGQFVAIAG